MEPATHAPLPMPFVRRVNENLDILHAASRGCIAINRRMMEIASDERLSIDTECVRWVNAEFQQLLASYNRVWQTRVLLEGQLNGERDAWPGLG
jgi:hypothetical protein